MGHNRPQFASVTDTGPEIILVKMICLHCKGKVSKKEWIFIGWALQLLGKRPSCHVLWFSTGSEQNHLCFCRNSERTVIVQVMKSFFKESLCSTVRLQGWIHSFCFMHLVTNSWSLSSESSIPAQIALYSLVWPGLHLPLFFPVSSCCTPSCPTPEGCPSQAQTCHALGPDIQAAALWRQRHVPWGLHSVRCLPST